MSSSVILLLCPAYLVRLTWVVCEREASGCTANALCGTASWVCS